MIPCEQIVEAADRFYNAIVQHLSDALVDSVAVIAVIVAVVHCVKYAIRKDWREELKKEGFFR